MLFNSYVFLLAFLPLALVSYFVCARISHRLAAFSLVLSSFVFYGWWNVAFVPLLALSIAFNFTTSRLIGSVEGRPRLQNWLLAFGIAANIGALIYFKYLAASVRFIDTLGFASWSIPDIVLPLGISFFTFTQIGYLVDCRQGVATERSLLSYVLFVTFFPHLIAGPILHNREMMPQFADRRTFRFDPTNFAVGGALFTIGLLKKGLLADPTSSVVGAGFSHAADLPLLVAWNVALCYSLQLYFDFSGYSDMAIGLARMFNVRFPLNFNSPYKAASVIEYWQRWHMTLTRYLTLYLYNPVALAITRRRSSRGLGITRAASRTAGGFASMVVAPTVFTMALAGVWHGAGLQFLVFGLLHALYLCVNHVGRTFFPRPQGSVVGPARHAANVLATYLAVLVAVIFFRAPGVGSAVDLLVGMLGFHGVLAPLPGHALPLEVGAYWSHREDALAIVWLVTLYAIVWIAPNSQQILSHYEPALGHVAAPSPRWPTFRLTARWGIALGLGACLGLLSIGGTTEFLYFQF